MSFLGDAYDATVGKVVGPNSVTGQIADTTLGKAALLAAAVYFLGPAAAESLPADATAADIAAAAGTTPEAVTAYGTSAGVGANAATAAATGSVAPAAAAAAGATAAGASSWMVPAAIVGSSLLGANAAANAASTAANATNNAAALQNAQYYQTRADQMPWMVAGQNALNQLIPLASNYTPFSYNSMTADPGYQFRLQQGQQALGHQAAAGGGLVSGQTLKAMQDYAQQSASNEYQNAFNRYQTQRAAQLAPLQSLAGVGQTTAANLGVTGAQTAANVGNLVTSGASAQAAGQIGQANALSSGLSTYLNYNQQNSLLNAINNRNNNNSSNPNQYPYI